jgi:hypothetical protein
MSKRIYRFLFYIALGLVFGIIDWFYLDWLAHLSWGDLGKSLLVVPVIVMMNFGIWLVPIIPAVIFETRYSSKVYYPMLVGMITWSCAILSYYMYYAALLSMGKLIQLEHLNIFGEKYDTFWYEYWQMFKGIILAQFFEWIIIAVIGGAIIGSLIFWLLHKKIHPNFTTG